MVLPIMEDLQDIQYLGHFADKAYEAGKLSNLVTITYLYYSVCLYNGLKGKFL